MTVFRNETVTGADHSGRDAADGCETDGVDPVADQRSAEPGDPGSGDRAPRRGSGTGAANAAGADAADGARRGAGAGVATGSGSGQRARPDGWAPPAGRPPLPPPPPTGPPSPGGPPGSDGEPSFTERIETIAGAVGVRDIDLPFDSLRSAAEWWFRPIADTKWLLALLTLFVWSVVGPLFFGLTVAILSVAAALSLVVVGLLLVVPAAAAINGFAAAARRSIGWYDEPVPPRELAPTGRGIVAPIVGRITDPNRWRQVAFLLLDVVVAPAAFAVAIAPVTFVFGWIFDFQSGPFSPSLGGLLLAIPVAGLAPRVALLIARLRREYIAFFLGPDRQAELEGRVETLSTQRDQILEAVAGERRRIERNLHDGVQQQLVALGIDIGRARTKIDDDPEAARELLDDAVDKVRGSIGELRLIGRGLHPAVLSDRGLDAALSAIVADAPIPITVEVTTERELPLDVAETAYYVVNESVTNILKYAGARVASIRIADDPGALPAVRVTVHDDGRGGADLSRGSGLAGMRARVDGVDGVFEISSPRGGPTIVTAVLPIRKERRDEQALAPGADAPKGER